MLIPTFVAKNTLFFMPINQDQFWGSNAKVCATYAINANVAIKVSDSQQKYVVLSAMRRSGGISKNLLMKKLKSKVYVSFLICLHYVLMYLLRYIFIRYHSRFFQQLPHQMAA